MNVENDILVLVDDDFDLIVPWYYIAKYATEEENDPIVDEMFLEWMRTRIDIHRDEINHRYKPYLESEEYPPGIRMAVDEIRRIYG